MSDSGDGSVVLPAELKVGKFAEARVSEIVELRKEIAVARQGQLPSQQVPRHLRRRAVSHNPNRLPRRLRRAHVAIREKSEGKDAAGKKPKRPSRRYRRRPSNLLEEYNRRQRKGSAWLETHIWHAKRFHMADMWGYKVPHFPNDKCFRACHRAAANKCLMRDVSYEPCIQIEGPIDEIVSKLSAVAPGFAQGGQDDDVLGGKIEGKTFIYSARKHPQLIAVGEVSYLWRPQEPDKKAMGCLWIFCHPAYYEELKDEIVCEVFHCQAVPNNTQNAEEEQPPKKRRKKDVNAAKLATRNVPFNRAPKYHSETGTVTVTLLKDTINRFRLIGPESGAVLAASLRRTEVAVPKSECKEEKWWMQECSTESDKARLSAQWEALEGTVAAARPAEVRAGSVFAVTVRDPRAVLPKKRRAVKEKPRKPEVLDKILFDPELCKSPIWNSTVRDEVSLNKCPDAEINRKRSSNLVPGCELPLMSDEARVPVLLIQQSGGSSHDGFGSGWDLLVPAGWGTSFWVNLVYNGARVGGVREAAHLQLEVGRLKGIAQSPDSDAGMTAASESSAVMRRLHFSHPPDKRPNFVKLGTPCPFSMPWPALIEDYLREDVGLVQNKGKAAVSEMAKSFYVLRDRQLLEKWHHALIEGAEVKVEKEEKMALIPVKLEMVGKGNIKSYTMICIPKSKEDIQSETNIDEPAHNDEAEGERKTLRDKHKSEKSKMRAAWKRKKEQLQELMASARVRSEPVDEAAKENLVAEVRALKRKREEVNTAYVKGQEHLWLPGNLSRGLKNECSRSLIGFIVEGGYSYRSGKAVGLGFVPAVALEEFIETTNTLGCRRIVLTRQPDMVRYRSAMMTVVI